MFNKAIHGVLLGIWYVASLNRFNKIVKAKVLAAWSRVPQRAAQVLVHPTVGAPAFLWIPAVLQRRGFAAHTEIGETTPAYWRDYLRADIWTASSQVELIWE